MGDRTLPQGLRVKAIGVTRKMKWWISPPWLLMSFKS